MPSFTLRTDIDQRLPLFSTIGAGGEVFRTTQLALLAASQEAGVTRFAPSEFTVLKYEGLDLCAPKVPVQDAVKASGLEYTLFSRGIFMNGFAAGIPKGEEEALALLRPWNFVVNIQAGTADVPGMGEETVTFTEIGDVCRFVAAALELENVKIEKVTVRKMLVKTNSVVDMQKMAEDPSLRFYHQVRIAMVKGMFVVEPTLNRLVPSVNPVSIDEFLEKWWSGVELGEAQWEKDTIFAF